MIKQQTFCCCLYLPEYEGKYLEMYLNIFQKLFKYKLRNVFDYSV